MHDNDPPRFEELELPRDDQLRKMQELMRSLECSIKLTPADGAMWTHWKETGHRLRFGCCRDALEEQLRTK